MTPLFGWLFDAYPAGAGIRVWLIDAQGQAHALEDRFTPTFYASGPRGDLQALSEAMLRRGGEAVTRFTERVDLFLDRPIEVLEVNVRVPRALRGLFHRIAQAYPDLTYYDADIPMPQRYVLARGIFPLAYCAVEHERGRIRRIEALDSPWDVDYRLPPLRLMTLRLEGELRDPTRGHRGDLLVEIDGQRICFPRRRGRELVLGMRHLLERHDPDALISAYGDNYILPRLIQLARHYGVPLPLNRDPSRQVLHKRAHSYFSYGRVIFRDQQHHLFGRWHLDRQNAFLSNYYGLDGILEIARISGLPVQTVARVSTGTGISAMQVATALRRGVLVPWQKRQPESLKSVPHLLAADKGGLVYTPLAGLYEGVAELDFTAMYPSIMVYFNVSPETVGTQCCRGELVPELGTHICRHRQGLVPATLAPLLEKRNRYKAMIRTLPPGDPKREVYQRRYSAHKWLLVTCFGYLGYKNARFGRIEAHEAVNAYGREVLLQAKERVEAHGFRVLHMYVDGLWIHKPGATHRELETLLEEIRTATKLQIGLEGVYRWLAFLPSRTEPRVAVANRYFGAFEDGTIKLRGIEARRHDTPPYIQETQLRMLSILAQARGAAEFRQIVPQAVAYAQERLCRLRAGEVAAAELVVTHRLSRRLQEYRVRTAAARAASQLARAGSEISPGEMLHFLYVAGPQRVQVWEQVEAAPQDSPPQSQRAVMLGGLAPQGSPIRGASSRENLRRADPVAGALSYDREAYAELLLRAVESVLAPVGVDRATLETWLIGDAGYWGPPGVLPPPGADIAAPLLEQARTLGLRPTHAARPGIFQLPAAVPLAADYKTPLAQRAA